jgi:uncharacterized protein (TIGR00730 family)
MKNIAVYGSSMCLPDNPDYIASYQVGRALASAGFSVMTGGYGGVMEAASKGAAEVGGHVIGVTTDVFNELRGDGANINTWLTEEIRYPTFRERILHLVRDADAYVCMPGGLGTLHELIASWEYIRVGDLPVRPIICYGDYWVDVLKAIRDTPYVKTSDWDYITFVKTAEDVVNVLQAEKAKQQS